MKKFLLLTLLLGVFTLGYSQSSMFAEGDKLLNIGIGNRFLGTWSFSSVVGSIDYCLADDIADKGSIGVGLYGGFGANASSAYISGGIQGSFHYPLIDDLDTYAGIRLGASFSTGSSLVRSTSGFFIGANYPLSDSFKVFAEVGAGVTNAAIGITLALN